MFTLYNLVLIYNLFNHQVATGCLQSYTYHIVDGVQVELVSTNEYCNGNMDVIVQMSRKDSDGKIDYVYINEDRE